MNSRKGVYLLLSLAIVHGLGIFLLWQQITGFLQNYSTNTANSLWWHDTKNSLLLKPNVPWNNETAREEVIQRALEKYTRKSSDQLDILGGFGIQGVLQMVDPKGGRSWECLEAYFQNWKNINEDIPRVPLFESFFEWLDYGKGRDTKVIDTKSGKECKRDMAFKRYRVFNETERAMTEMNLDVDKNGHISNITFVYSGTKPDTGKYVFVWGLDRKIYMRDEKIKEDTRRWGHASFFCGKPVLFAGEMYINIQLNKIVMITDRSGNYKPALPYMLNFYLYMRDEKGVNVTEIKWRKLIRKREGELDLDDPVHGNLSLS